MNSPLLRIEELRVRENSKAKGVKNQILLLRIYFPTPEDLELFPKKIFRFVKENFSRDNTFLGVRIISLLVIGVTNEQTFNCTRAKFCMLRLMNINIGNATK